MSLGSHSVMQGDNTLRAWRTGIDTYQEFVVYMRRDCPACRSEGFTTQARVLLSAAGQRSIVATLSVVEAEWLSSGDAGLSESAWAALGAQPGEPITVSHAPPLYSLSHVRAKVYGHKLGDTEFAEVISDVAAGRYSDLHLATFVTACAGDRLDLAETVSLTKAMIAAGDRIDWGRQPVVDKHCVGGLPGNRTTLLVVPIVAACGLTIPKTSSRAITSPAGTADTMEVLAPVDLDIASMRRAVERTGACIVWGGSVRLSPADDVLIRVERPLDLDSEGQLVASVLSKKAAAGSTHVLIDLPVGRTAKVRSEAAATSLGRRLQEVGAAIGLHVSLRLTDGEQPVGRGIGPALEARDVLAVLQGAANAPDDLRQRALCLAGDILEMGGVVPAGSGLTLANQVLADGRAWARFQDICAAQGGMREIPVAPHRQAVDAHASGRIVSVDNRVLARAAKLAGAPTAPAAGIDVHARLGEYVEKGQALFTLHSQAPGELAYAMSYVASRPPIFQISPTGESQ
ncbi:thymidine phosphorylase family protein [Pelomonas puraquae]|jgi:thymidine phosphorylase|uniref:Putative thymidine phosphorylase n=2 Tax=Roseateles puraquae TaxID=431059 RepID=A0A254MZT7_9BURK|nr:thymidine phosphorylase family protein [Roseateles puraquae]OWQ99917.1 thymidine phosphorylase [Roseateles puraquae]